MSRVAVICEFSGRVREAFRARGHEAVSFDLLPAEDGSPHHRQGDVFSFIAQLMFFDMAICFPDCKYLTRSGMHWCNHAPKTPRPGVLYGEERKAAVERAIEFVMRLWRLPIEMMAIENPAFGFLAQRWRKPDQIIEPWEFGHGETKKTGIWLRGLPPLMATVLDPGREGRIWKEPPGPDRWKNRSRTYPGVADAMAEQWGRRLVEANQL